MKSFDAMVRMVTVGVLMTFAGTVAAQQDYPNKTVRIVNAYAPGGTTTIVARLIGQKLTESWGQQFIVDNRPGGGTLIGTEIVAKSPPDGYTLMLVDSAIVLAPVLLKAPYDPIKDFAAVATVASTELVLVLHPSHPPNNLAEFIAYAKSKPGKLNYATAAIGSTQHLATEIFNIDAGIQTQHIPYKGAGPALIALVAGEVDMFLPTTATAVPLIKAGKLKAIAITGKKRSPLLPNVPTFDEAGLPNFYSHKRAPFGIVAPAGTPRPIVEKLSAEILKYVAQPEFREALLALGLDPYLANSSEYADILKANLTWNIDTINLLKKRGVKFDS